MRRPLVLIPQYFGCLLFDRRTSRYLPFDAAATAFLSDACERPVREVVAAHPEPQAAVDLVRRLRPLALLAPDGRLAAERLTATPPVDHLLGPLATHVEVIAACNLSCTHCFAAPLPRGRDPLTLAELQSLFAQLAAVGSFRLGLTGGEPLLRPDFFDVLDAATDAGLHPCLTTNGDFLTDEVARRLSTRELVWVNISLDGATAASNDRVRGAGSFARVMARLAAIGGKVRFTLAFTLTADNVGEAEQCLELAEAVGADTAVFRPLYPTGAALARPELMLSFDDYQGALASLGDGRCDARGLDPFSPQARSETSGRVHPGHGCGAATTVCSVSVEGRVNPCSFIGADYDAGTIRERSFRELWDEGWSFRRLRDERGEAFDGGCRARALAAEGSVHAPDPWAAAWRRTGGVGPDRNLEAQIG